MNVSAAEPASKVVPPLVGSAPINVLGDPSPVNVSVAEPTVAVLFSVEPT